MVTNTKYQGFSLDAYLDQVVTILGAVFAETYGLTATLITDFLENGEELTFPDYLEWEREDMSVISVDIFSICLNDVALQTRHSPLQNETFSFFFFLYHCRFCLLFSLSTNI